MADGSLLQLPLAHAVGMRGDLPLPLWAVAYGAAGVLVATFVLLVRTWPKPRLEAAGAGWAVPARLEYALAVLVPPARLAGLVVFVVVVAAGLVGPDSTLRNLAPFALYVGAWVGGLFANALLGDVWRVLNPVETVALAAAGLDVEPPGWLVRAGVWPATAALVGYTWLELVYPTPGDPRVVGSLLAGFAAVVVVGAMWWGPRWARAVDPFGRLFELVAAMAPVGRGEDGRLRVRAPLVGLTGVTPRRGTTALVLVALGTTSYDGLSRTGLWDSLVGAAAGWAAAGAGTAGMLASVGLVTGLYLWGANGIAKKVEGLTAGEAADRFVHSLIPIVVGYALAHYFSLLVFEGQRLLALASDPFGTGANLFGTAGWSIDLVAVSPLTIALVQTAAIVGGHIAAVVLAHDRAVALLPAGRPAEPEVDEHAAAHPQAASHSQYPLLVAMVAYTIGGLFLLLGA